MTSQPYMINYSSVCMSQGTGAGVVVLVVVLVVVVGVTCVLEAIPTLALDEGK